MFNTLESNWDQSARRGWSTLASFGFQAMAVSLLLAIPLIWVQTPPRITWLQVAAPVFQTAATPPDPVPQQRYHAATVSNFLNQRLLIPDRIPTHPAMIDDSKLGPPAPNVGEIDFGPRDRSANSVPWGGGNAIPIVVPKPPLPSHPIRVSRWAEGNLIYRVQPVYPPLARQARIQGAVVLRAIVSKKGTIEQLTTVSGHPMLVGSALDAVRQWRYRPYLLNDEPIEIETEITVNFVLSGQ